MISAIFRWGVWLLVMGAALGVVLGFGGALTFDLDVFSHFRLHFGVLAAVGGLIAVWLPRRRVRWIGLGAAALAFATLGPVWRSVERPASTSVETRAVTVMTANLRMRNPTLDLTVSALKAANADVLATQETPHVLRGPTSALSQMYPYRSDAGVTGRHGIVLWSKLPLRRVEALRRTREAPASITAFVDLGGGAGFGMTSVHLNWPLVSNGAQGKQVGLIGSLLPAEAGPKLLVGDFNAAPWSEAMKRVEANTGLRMIGGLRRTWRGAYPNPLHFLTAGKLYGREIPAPLGLHIDQVLLSGGIGVDAIEVFPLPGSDHRAVWTKLEIPLRRAGNLYAGG